MNGPALIRRLWSATGGGVAGRRVEDESAQLRKLIAGLTAAAALVAPAAAVAENKPVGEHVSQCARIALPPADGSVIVCDHDGHVHTFGTFGEMVLHLLEHHG
jgi:hypothetical protein